MMSTLRTLCTTLFLVLLTASLGGGSALAQTPVSTVKDDQGNNLMRIFDNGNLELFQNGTLTTPGMIELTGGGIILPDGTVLSGAGDLGGLGLPFSRRTSASDPLVDLTQTGGGLAGVFEINNQSNSTDALFASTNGSGNALFASTVGSGNALFARTTGGGDALVARTSGTGTAGEFTIDNTSNSASALRAETNGSGNAALFSGGDVVAEGGNIVAQTGDIEAANGDIVLSDGTALSGSGDLGGFSLPFSGTASTSTAGNLLLELTQTGAVGAGLFRIDNQGSASTALSARTNGNGNALKAIASGSGSGNALQASAAGGGPTLTASNTGSGRAGFFEIDNTNSSASALRAETDGSGNAALFSGGDVVAEGGNIVAQTGDIEAANGDIVLSDGTALSGSGDLGGFSLPFSRSTSTADPLLELTQTGGGSVGLFAIDNPSSNINALGVSTNGNGSALFTQTSGGGDAINAQTSGSGAALDATATGSAPAGIFAINNQGSSADALVAFTDGSGNAAFFEGGDVVAEGGNIVAQTGDIEAANGDIVLSDGTALSGAGDLGGFSLPFDGGGSTTSDALLSVEQTGGGLSGRFTISNQSNNGNALEASTNGNGQAGVFQVNNTSNSANALSAFTTGSGNAFRAATPGSGNALKAITTGSGQAGVFEVDNTSSSADAIVATTNGSGQAGVFTADNPEGAALRVQNNGTGPLSGAFRAVSEGGIAGDFRLDNANSSADALVATTNGTGNAGRFEGDVQVNGTLNANSKNFKIDHPQDPTGKYLKHAAVESPRRLTTYTGNVTLGSEGAATVALPDYFEALNRNYRYQLTAIGAAAPRLHVAEEISNGTFRVAGGKPGMKVSWRVTAVRDDAWARTHPLQVEKEKPPSKQGTYVNPEAHGASQSRGETPSDSPQESGSSKKPEGPRR